MPKLNPKAFATVLSGAALAAAVFFAPYEGDSSRTYADPPGVSTDCIGHTKGVKAGDIETPAQCLQFLKQDTLEAAHEVERDVHVKMPEKTEAAFISFTFNAGAAEFRNSSMVRDANRGDLRMACADLDVCVETKKNKWVGFGCGWADGERFPGLEKRRAAEKALCLEGVNE